MRAETHTTHRRSKPAARKAKSTTPKRKTSSARTAKAKRPASTKMKAASTGMKAKRSGTSKTLSSGSRRVSTSSASARVKRQPKYPDLPESQTEEVSHTLTSQPKMRLARRGGKKSSTQFRERQRRESGPSNQVNPSSRIR